MHEEGSIFLNPELQSRWLYRFTAPFGQQQMIGRTPHGLRLFSPTIGGSFEGPELKGKILPGGGDWLLIRPDGVAEMHIREIARTDDEQMIYVSATGLIVATPEIFQQWQQGQPVEPSRYSMRSVYAFETAAERYAWLNRIVAVGVYTRTPAGIEGDVYQIL
jgi:hypothetical protein